MPIAPDFHSIHSEKFEIAFTQCLPTGYLKYTELLNLLQLTAAGHADKGGISFTDMQRDNQAWVMSKMRIEIVALPKWRDTIIIKTWIVHLENSRSVRALEVSLNGEKVIGCETYWAVINTKIRRPQALTIDHSHFEKYENKFATSKRVAKISLPSAMQTIQTHNVVLSDLDIVNHVNNVKYLEWCLDCEDPQNILENKIKILEMNFMRELRLNDSVEIRREHTGLRSVFSLDKNGKSCFILDIQYKH